MAELVPIIVLLVVGLAISRLADPINELLSHLVPSRVTPTSLSGSRVVLWIVAAIFAVIAVGELKYDPLDAVGIAGAADIWNILFLITITDAMDVFFKRRLVR